MHCLIDGCRGIYVGQALAELLRGDNWGNVGELGEDLDILEEGPHNLDARADFYWEALVSVLDAWRGDKGEFLYNGESGDIFLVEGEDDADWIALTEDY